MSEGETIASPIRVAAHPTEADYQEALVAHAIWPRILNSTRISPRRIIVIVVVVGGLAIALIVISQTTLLTFSEWLVDPLPFLAALFVFPLWVASLLVMGILRTPSGATPCGIMEVERGKTSGAANNRRKIAGTVGWVLLLIMSVLLVAWESSKENRPPASPIAAESEDVPTPRKISGALLIFGNIFALSAVLIPLAKLRSRRGAKRLVAAMPSLLLARTWEFGESGLSEKGELLQSIMKWEYIQKFLEAPDHILLYPSDQTFFLVPKRAFADELQLSVFLGLLSRKVPNGVMQKRWRAFPVLPRSGND